MPRPRACAFRQVVEAVSGLRGLELQPSKRRCWRRPESAECGLGGPGPAEDRGSYLFFPDGAGGTGG